MREAYPRQRRKFFAHRGPACSLVIMFQAAATNALRSLRPPTSFEYAMRGVPLSFSIPVEAKNQSISRPFHAGRRFETAAKISVQLATIVNWPGA